MKNIDVLFMVNSGTLNITNHELDPKSAYKIVKFRTALNKAFDKIQELEKKLIEDAEIEDVNEFNEKLKKLQENKNRTPEEEKEFQEISEKGKKYNELRAAMLDDEITLENVLTISYDDWHTLRKENRPKDEKTPDPLNNYIETILENVLWTAPKDE